MTTMTSPTTAARTALWLAIDAAGIEDGHQLMSRALKEEGQEAAAAAIWKAAQDTPGFNEAMEEGLTDLREGRVTSLREIYVRDYREIVERIAVMDEQDHVRDYEQGLCFFCDNWPHVDGCIYVKARALLKEQP